MNTVGMFAGRGDVVLGYIVCALAFFWLGWAARKRWHSVKLWWVGRKSGGGQA